jgi:hypothetical protein
LAVLGDPIPFKLFDSNQESSLRRLDDCIDDGERKTMTQKSRPGEHRPHGTDMPDRDFPDDAANFLVGLVLQIRRRWSILPHHEAKAEVNSSVGGEESDSICVVPGLMTNSTNLPRGKRRRGSLEVLITSILD